MLLFSIGTQGHNDQLHKICMETLELFRSMEWSDRQVTVYAENVDCGLFMKRVQERIEEGVFGSMSVYRVIKEAEHIVRDSYTLQGE